MRSTPFSRLPWFAFVLACTCTLVRLTASEPSAAEPAPVLRGLVFVPALADVVADGRPDATGLEVSRVTALQEPRLRSELERWIGQTLTADRIDPLLRHVNGLLAASRYPFSRAFIPPQTLAGGVLQLVVAEGRVGEVRVEGARWFSERSYLERLRVTPEAPLDRTLLEADVDELNRSAFRRVTILTEPGKSWGTTNLALRADERRPWRLSTGWEDTGTRTTDDGRWFGAFVWGNALGRGDQFNYRLGASRDFEKSVSHSAGYAMGFRGGATLSVNGAYSTIRSEVPLPFEQEGVSWQVGVRYDRPLPAAGNIQHAWSAGVDFKSSDNNLLFSTTPITDNVTHIAQASLGYRANRNDGRGGWSGSATLTGAPGGLTGRNHGRYFEVTRADAEATYVYGTVDVARTTLLPLGLTWVASLRAQAASGNLLGSEQLAFGGAYSLRGYDEGEVYADQGVLVKNELWLPDFNVGAAFAAGRWTDRLQPLVFWDYGHANIHTPLPGEQRNLALSSVGVGFRYQFRAALSARFDYGWQLEDSGFNRRNNHRGHVNVTLSW